MLRVCVRARDGLAERPSLCDGEGLRPPPILAALLLPFAAAGLALDGAAAFVRFAAGAAFERLPPAIRAALLFCGLGAVLRSSERVSLLIIALATLRP